MADHVKGSRESRSTPSRSSHTPGALVVLLAVLLAGWTQAQAGIIELGRKGKKASGSRTVVIVQNDFFEKVHDPNEPVEAILEALRQAIDSDPDWEATTWNDILDPNRNAIMVVRESSKREPNKLRIEETDSNFRRTGTEYLGRPRPRAEYREVDAIDPNTGGDVRIDIVLDDSSTVVVQVNVDPNNNTAEKVNDKLKEKLEGEGFNVTCSQEGNCKVWKPSRKIRKILFTHTNTGVSRSAAGMEGEVEEIPALSDWGLLALVLLLSATGVYLLRRTRLRARA